ncbi:hypothetical protein JZ751_010083, partial [Albula glossodonta]
MVGLYSSKTGWLVGGGGLWGVGDSLGSVSGSMGTECPKKPTVRLREVTLSNFNYNCSSVDLRDNKPFSYSALFQSSSLGFRAANQRRAQQVAAVKISPSQVPSHTPWVIVAILNDRPEARVSSSAPWQRHRPCCDM